MKLDPVDSRRLPADFDSVDYRNELSESLDIETVGKIDDPLDSHTYLKLFHNFSFLSLFLSNCNPFYYS
jgi:hypothetical protein